MATKVQNQTEDSTVEERTVNGFVAANPAKWHRAVYGTVIREGALTGGVGETASLEAKLAEYDKLAGLITKDGRKVKTGSFYDFKGKKPHENPTPVLEFRIDGEVVEVPVGDAIPLEVQAGEIAKEKKALKKKAKPSIEDEE